MTPKYTYNGDGTQFVMGVPARDLSSAEFEALPQEQQEECLLSGLYIPPAETKKKLTEANNG